MVPEAVERADATVFVSLDPLPGTWSSWTRSNWSRKAGSSGCCTSCRRRAGPEQFPPRRRARRRHRRIPVLLLGPARVVGDRGMRRRRPCGAAGAGTAHRVVATTPRSRTHTLVTLLSPYRKGRRERLHHFIDDKGFTTHIYLTIARIAATRSRNPSGSEPGPHEHGTCTILLTSSSS